ncbi:MAG: hypothetical protein IKT35_01260 [Clostridia bacterium]|nr:hypothetical protein [Clostridia bacterium]
MKKLTSLILTFSLLLSIFCGLSFQVASADTLWGIDVSHYQGDINWTKVKAAGVDFVIIQAGYEYTKNQRFEEYYAGAKAAGIPVGAYLYTYADNVDEATREANALLTFLEGKTFEYPIYIDVEESSKYSKYTKDFVANLVLTELEILSAAGYYCGVYTYTNFANNYINMSKLSAYTTWIAEYNSKCNYKGAYDMWQYSSDLSVSGVSSARCDTNYCYVDFESIIKAGGYNGFEPESDEPVVLEDKVIIDGTTTANTSVNASHYATTVETANGKKSGEMALKMNFNDPDSKASSTQVGGMMFYNFSTAQNLSNYEYLYFDIYLPQDMTGTHNFQVNFITSNEDGYNQNNDISGWKAGWHTIVIPLKEVEMAATANWKNINKIRFTWFNNANMSEATYMLLGNVTLTQTEPVIKEEVIILYGDIDGDQKISVEDALLVLQFSVNKITFTAEQFTMGDVNNDVFVDATDALLILQYSVEKISSFPR